MPAPNNIPIGNIDFVSPSEAMSALQRNWQIGSQICTGNLTTSFSASTIYGVVIDGGTVKIADNTTRYSFIGPGAWFFQLGMPTIYLPPGGPVFAVAGSTGNNITILYK